MRKDLLKPSRQSNDGGSTGYGHLLVREISEGYHLSTPTPNEVQYLLQSHSPLDKLVEVSTWNTSTLVINPVTVSKDRSIVNYICFPPKIIRCCTGGMPSFSSILSLIRDTYL